jgi:hypothetical protein
MNFTAIKALASASARAALDHWRQVMLFWIATAGATQAIWTLSLDMWSDNSGKVAASAARPELGDAHPDEDFESALNAPARSRSLSL